MLKRFIALCGALTLTLALATTSLAAQPVGASKHANKGVTCTLCHKENPPAKAVSSATCISCHGDNDALAKRTPKVTPNPHFNHLGDVECTECHKNHAPSVLICSECHVFPNLKTP